MNVDLRDRLHQEVQTILHISARDLPKRIATMTLMCVLLWSCGAFLETLIIAVLTFVSEAIFFLIHQVNRGLATGRELPFRLVLLNWFASTVSTLAFVGPTPVLVSIGSVPMLISAYFWIFGVLVHITNSYVDLPFYNRSQVVPAYSVLILSFWIAAGQDFANGQPFEWLLLAAIAIVYGVNTYQTMEQQRETQQQLDGARKAAQARLKELERLARFDTLTGLPNRTAFEEDFQELRSGGRHARSAFAVMVIDLDGFKPINDSYGHRAGDQVLRAVSARLAAFVGQNGLAARIGGDEFAAVFWNVASASAAESLANSLAADLSAPIPHSGPELRVGASIGVALAKPLDTSLQRLITEADQAMYRAKSDPSQQSFLFDDSFAPRLNLDDKRTIESALRNGRIRPFYQPKVSLMTGRIVGFEALARWVHQDGTVESPAAFLPQIDEAGLHSELLEAIATRVISELPRFWDAGLGAGRIAINLPETSLASRKGHMQLLDICGQRDGSLSSLTFEITEDVLISRAGSTLAEVISDLRRRGGAISLDDFGTGYASFQHLRQLEFDEMKIDRSFVAGICEDGPDAVLVEGFMSIARGLGVSVVAEGVEELDQETHLRMIGCDTAQGYRYGRALPTSEALVLLTAENPGQGISARPGGHGRRTTPSEDLPAAAPPLAGQGGAGGQRKA